MGLLPDQFWDLTLREVVWYNNGFMRREAMRWDHTASMMALQANIASGGKGKKFRANDFHPYSNLYDKNEVSTGDQARELLDKMKKF